ncbi:glycosyltransferase [Polaribacter sp. WD7]|uniref:glycosyltransferase family 2 protein n=1 Tax=Polaribacter sp. WD7 TaxID=2269061 RepID=UPI000DF242CB|nr:glycosyltransferase [Polaribacter sp. WD7]RCS27056.1 glycosyltransferase [Polaribacter sp. WD7]
MNLSLIICTYMRPKPLTRLLESILIQGVYPNEILIIDGSSDDKTQKIIQKKEYKNLKYFKVSKNDRGLTKQRNYGIKKCSKNTDIVSFLDDDTVLYPNYFQELKNVFFQNKSIIGVGGVAVNENRWKLKKSSQKYNSLFFYCFDNYVIKEGLRNIVRNIFGLQSNLPPNCMPSFSHGRTYSYPLNNKVYEVDLLVGMSFSFRKIVFDHIKFSRFFEGYGLYEDADFSIRAQNFGKNVIATSCKLNHYHDPSGRPNQFKYGKMVTINGWYVWRLKYPNPSFKSKLKWHFNVLILSCIRLTNVLKRNKGKQAITEFLGRIFGWLTLFFKKPKVML